MRVMTANDIGISRSGGGISRSGGGISRSDDFARVLDQFAALRSYAGSTSAVGGYRVMVPRRAGRKERRDRTAAFARRTRDRLRFSGSLSVVFIGGLALAVLAGPASCPCNLSALDTGAKLSRLSYVQTASLTAAGALPVPSTAALLTPDEIAAGAADAAGAAAISIAATGSLREIAPVTADALSAARIGRLPVAIEPVADTRPAEIRSEVRLAAASPVDGELLPTLPLVELAGPTTTPAVEIEATDAAGAEKHRSARIHAHSEERRSHKKRTVKRLYRSGQQGADPAKAQRYPKWAKQMFDNPWQSQAFSYTR